MVDDDVTVRCAPASEEFFKVGTTLVRCTATDDADNKAERSFNINLVLLTYQLNSNPDPSQGNGQTRAQNEVPAKRTTSGAHQPVPAVSA